MAAIIRRADRSAKYRWQAKVRRTGFPYQTKSFPTKAEAQAWASAIEADMRKGTFTDTTVAQNTRMEELFAKYAEKVSSTKKGEATEITRLNAMRKGPLAKYTVANVTSDVIAKIRDERLKVVSGSTVNRELNLLSHIFSVAMMEWKINLPVNPVSRMRRPKNNKPRERRLEDGEEAILLRECSRAQNPYLYSIVILAIETGMRRSEIVHIERPKIDLDKGLAIPRTMRVDGYRYRSVQYVCYPISKPIGMALYSPASP